jgi:hypothetical protein
MASAANWNRTSRASEYAS